MFNQLLLIACAIGSVSLWYFGERNLMSTIQASTVVFSVLFILAISYFTKINFNETEIKEFEGKTEKEIENILVSSGWK